jgi:drug/metabolite transporter (DMT)-like permease
MVYIPILGALALASGTILQRVILKKKKISIRTYSVLEFLAIVIAMLPLIYFFWQINSEALQLKNILIFILVVIFSILANLLTYYSVKGERVSNLEPAKILEPLFTILLAILFSVIFGEVLFERNLKIILPALIAAATLVLTHLRKHHLNFNKYFLTAIAGSFFFALELVISRLILNYYSPVTFYFLRSLGILLIAWLAFRPNLKAVDKTIGLKALFTGVIWVIYRIAVYYGYLKYGIIFTTLIVMLGPIFVYSFAKIFLKEKLSWKNLVAAGIIIICILYATVV